MSLDRHFARCEDQYRAAAELLAKEASAMGGLETSVQGAHAAFIGQEFNSKSLQVLIATNFGVALVVRGWDNRNLFSRSRSKMWRTTKAKSSSQVGLRLELLSPCCRAPLASSNHFPLCLKCYRQAKLANRSFTSWLGQGDKSWDSRFRANVKHLAVASTHGLDPLALELALAGLEDGIIEAVAAGTLPAAGDTMRMSLS